MSNIDLTIGGNPVWVGMTIYVICAEIATDHESESFTPIPIQEKFVPYLDFKYVRVLEFIVAAVNISKNEYCVVAKTHFLCTHNGVQVRMKQSSYGYNWFFSKEEANKKLENIKVDIKLSIADIFSILEPANLKRVKQLGITKNSIPIRFNEFLKNYPGCVSDGYHTFTELYDHRAALFAALVALKPELAWKSKYHHDGTFFDGMFVVGMHLPTGDITYHCDINPWWGMFYCKELNTAPEFDGHTPNDVINRLIDYALDIHITKDSIS